MYISLSNLSRCTVQHIKEAHPNVSLPRNPTDAQLAPLGYAILHPTERPEGDVVTEGTPEKGQDGAWYQSWEFRDFTPEEMESRLVNAKKQKLAEINREYQLQVDPLISEYPNPEPLSWATQNLEADAYLAWVEADDGTDAPPTPILDAILLGRNEDGGTETVGELCDAVKRNTALFIQAQVLTGRRQRLTKQVEEATTLEDVNAVSWE